MSLIRTGSWRDLVDTIHRLYRSADEDAARLRGAHLNAVVRRTPQAMLANLASALVIACLFEPAAEPALFLWLCGLGALCCVGTWQWRQYMPRERASRRALRDSTVHGILLSGLWGVLAIRWFPGATAGQQLTIATLITGLIGAGSVVLNPLPLASMAWLSVITAASLCALWVAGEHAYTGVAVLLALYASMSAVGSLAAWRNATMLIEAQARSIRQEQLLSVLLRDFEQHADEAFWEISDDGLFRHQSSRLSELLGTADATVQRPCFLDLLDHGSPDGALVVKRALDEGRPFRDLQIQWRQSDDHPRVLSLSGKRIFDDDAQPAGWRGVLVDVTDKVESERRLHELARIDPLTALANRSVLRDALGRALASRHPVGLLIIDLDHFKTVNDTHGHTVGDELLKIVAARFRSCVRPGDVVARMGGDEFAVLQAEVSGEHDPTLLSERMIAIASEPIEVSGRRVHVGASVGVAISDSSDIDVDDMLMRADVALYAAKHEGRNRYATYVPRLGERIQRRLAIETGLRQAIAQSELTLHWQPKVDARTWQVIGAEALLRWTHPVLGRVSPAEFIPVAEQTGLIEDIGRYALDEACRAAADELDGLTVSVNVSAIQLRGSRFVSDVHDALAWSGLTPSRLELEITESVFIDDPTRALRSLHALRTLGVRIALDDFGTGYSSLSYLRQFPFDTLKIDRSFVKEIPDLSDSRAIVQMIANLATKLGMVTVCEGVETAAQLQGVIETGCDQIQGYLFSEPIALECWAGLRRDWRTAALPRTPGDSAIAAPATVEADVAHCTGSD